MTSNGNSVNIQKPPLPGGGDGDVRASYHHGDLRSALIAAGMAALDAAPAAALSLRALARSAGVSATAVYRHFPDKDALLTALGMAALDHMGQAQRAAMAAADDAGQKAALAASGAAYVRYAIAHPELFRLIWTLDLPHDVLSVPIEQSHPAMQGLRRAVRGLLPDGASTQDQRAAALHCWALVHGLAMLALDRHIHLDDATLARVLGGMDMG
ncbi:MAG: WHG domain-containing protein [Sphingopyxis sp.]